MNDMLYLGMGYLGAGIGAGIVLLGASLGIGKLAASAMEGTARQPEAGGAIRTSMIIAAALIEGLGFFALVICLLVAMNFSGPKQSSAGHDAARVQAHK